jgi:PTS system mannose-specific IIB component/fructoselysine and glucoselysine-specific PTS system IIB component
MMRLVQRVGTIRAVNLGGIHHRSGRVQRLRYLFLSLEEESALRSLAGQGIAVTAQDVPAARPIPLNEVLDGEGHR